MEAVCADPDAVPLMGVQAARSRPTLGRCAIANEAAIAPRAALRPGAGTLPRWLSKTWRPPWRKGTRAGRLLAHRWPEGDGGRGGHVGARRGAGGRSGRLGQETVLAAIRRAFASAGFKVLGTAVSGQAARTLGTEAGIDESRTLASLLWRLDHGQLKLDQRTVVCCDEAGMADDPAMLRLLAATEAAGRGKVVIIGDHRQIGAVGPAGPRSSHFSSRGGVHVLTENVRQADPEERAVLAELRAGEVETAVSWYAEHRRVKVAPGRDEVLDQMVASLGGRRRRR